MDLLMMNNWEDQINQSLLKHCLIILLVLAREGEEEGEVMLKIFSILIQMMTM